MTTLYNVIDKRTGLIHSVAIVKEQNVKHFVSAEQPEQPKKTTSKKKKG